MLRDLSIVPAAMMHVIILRALFLVGTSMIWIIDHIAKTAGRHI